MPDILLPIIPGTLPQDCYPASADAFQKLLLGLARAKLTANFNGVVYGENAPASSDWDKLWVRQDSGGNLIRVYTHGSYGVWVSPHPIPVGSLALMIWKGSEAELKAYDEGVDEAVTAVTGPFWEIDHDFDFKVPVGAGTNGTAYDGNPATVLAVGDTGGEERHVLLEAEMASHKHLMASSHTTDTTSDIDKSWEDIGGSEAATLTPEKVIDVTSGDFARVHPYTKTESGLTNRDKSHQNMPPYRTVYFAKRTARLYYKV